MKNQITRFLFFLLIFFACSPFYGQLEFVGSAEYGRIFNITYDPQVENKLYATSLNNHILVSEDNGENWNVLFSMTFGEVMEFQNLKMTNNNTALSFIKYNQDSPDNTILIFDLDTETIINEIEIPAISNVNTIQSYSIYPQDSNIILMNAVLDFGTSENTYYTTDGGQNWEVVYSKSDFDEVSLNNIAINPENPEHLILTRGFGPNGVEGGMLISTDAGQTWEVKLEGIVLNPVSFNPFNTDEIYAGTGISFGSTPENIYRSVDGGDSWETIPLMWTAGNLDNINYIAFNPNNEGHIIVLEENEIVISTDNGVSWTNYVYDMDDVHTYYSGWNLSFNPFNEDEVFINSDYFPLKSEDGGATTVWKKNNYFRSTGTLGMFSGITEHLYYGVQYGYVHRNLSTEVEENFNIMPLTAYSQGGAPPLFVDNTMEGRVFIFSSGWFGADLKVSVDHGQTQYQIHNSYMNYVDALVANPFNSNEVWYAMSNNMGDVEFWKADVTDLNAITSTPITTPETGTINGIYFDEVVSGKVIITIGTNVYKSEDNGATWILSSRGLEELVPDFDLILDLTANPLNTDQLTISTNKGVFTSMDGGDNWIKINENLVYKTYHSSITEGHIVGIVLNSAISDFAIVYSSDAGENWEEINNDELLKTAATDAIVKFQEDSAEVYIGSIDLGLMLYTIDLQGLGSEGITRHSSLIKAYPNPTNDILYLKSDKNSMNLSLYSLTGQLVFTESISSNVAQIDLSFLSDGIYLLKVENEAGVETLQVVKQ